MAKKKKLIILLVLAGMTAASVVSCTPAMPEPDVNGGGGRPVIYEPIVQPED